MQALFHPLVAQWFQQRFGEPTEPQRLGWPHIAEDRHTLIAAPTGSGKTLSAFLVCLDRMVRDWFDNCWDDSLQVIYVSPLKALSNDIERNLQKPLAEIQQLAQDAGLEPPPIRAAVRTGDTPSSKRAAMLRRPPNILVTTPESLYLLLTSEKSRAVVKSARYFIVDEIHALARDKRGSHLTLSVERLDALCSRKLVRVGLSATQRPIDDIARFLVGTTNMTADGQPDCRIIDSGHIRELDLALEVPPSELAAVCSHEQWNEVYQRLVELVNSHRSTLIFVNTRRLAERICHHLTEILGEEAVASHHGSLSRPLRLSAEQRLKSGQLKAIVATASLEMGIDIGYIDLVCQIGSPRSIATFLQRVGRSGHSLGTTPKGRLFPLTRDELLESLALISAVKRGQLDRIEIPACPLDILAQQIVATVASEEQDERELFDLCRRAWPFRDLSWEHFQEVVTILSEGLARGTRRGAWLHRDRIQGRLRARRGARLAALTSGGAIPENAEYRVLTEGERTYVGSLDEDFAIESQAGDIFLLGNTSWQVLHVRGGEVTVRDANGAPPTVPFWFGEAPGRTVELSAELSDIRQSIAQREGDAARWLGETCGADSWAAEQAIRYVAAEVAAIDLVPTQENIVFERFFDESGGMQLVVHAPLGARINRAWALALRKRFCRSFDFELQAAATDNGIVLSIGPQHSFAIESLFKMLGPHNARHLLEQALLAVPLFQVRWRWNVTRALGVLRFHGGKKVPPFLQRHRADDLLAAAFPETVGCLENHHGDVEVPDHPLVRQTMHDCLTEATDIGRWLDLLSDVQAGRVHLVARDTIEPSPFSHELLNANPYAFLDGAPLEERRTRAVSTRRSLTPADIATYGALDPAAIALVRKDAWPLVRDADELHDALLNLVVACPSEISSWSGWYDELESAGRATTITVGSDRFRIAAERWPLASAIWDDVRATPPVALPAELTASWQRTDAVGELIRGRISHAGPTSASELASWLRLEPSTVAAALEALEGQGVVLRGGFTGASSQEWCDRRLLARIHRLTLDGLRKSIQPVEPAQYLRFLTHHHGLLDRRHGPHGARATIEQLQGFEMPAGAWERAVLPARLDEYDPAWLDQLFLTGELTWARLQPPEREAERGPSMAIMTRAMPLSIQFRDNLTWLLPPDTLDRQDTRAEPGANARQVLSALASHGALFFPELRTASGLLPAQMEEALRELAASGLITSDTFAAVRTIVNGRRTTHRRRGREHRLAGTRAAVGRWSRFPGLLVPSDPEQTAQNWCELLLKRYGVVFRDLLVRESAAPAWRQLVTVYRRMELRGQVRGGRFVSGVSGEQFATESAVKKLREIRDREASDRWLAISAADPLNLTAILSGVPRVPATNSGSLILQDGQIAAFRQGGETTFLLDPPDPDRLEMQRALVRS